MQVPLLLVVPFHLSFLSFVAEVSCARAHLQSHDLLPDQKLVVEFLKNSSEGDSGLPSAASQTSVAIDQLDGQSGRHRLSEFDCRV